jgi:tetratricopeptide (TPR) repeat protein
MFEALLNRLLGRQPAGSRPTGNVPTSGAVRSGHLVRAPRRGATDRPRAATPRTAANAGEPSAGPARDVDAITAGANAVMRATAPDGTEAVTIVDDRLTAAIVAARDALSAWNNGAHASAGELWNTGVRSLAQWGGPHDRGAVATIECLYILYVAGVASEATVDRASFFAILTRTCASPASMRDPELCASLVAFARRLFADGLVDVALGILTGAMAMLETFRAPNHPERRSAASLLGKALGETGALEAALAQFNQAIGTAPTDDASLAVTLSAMSDRAATLFRLNRIDEAIAAGLAVLDVCERRKGLASADYAVAAGNLGMMYRHIGDAKSAERMLDRAVRLLEAHSPQHDDQLGRFLSMLSMYPNGRGDHTTARAMLERALRCKEQACGADASEVALTLIKLASTFAVDGHFAEARAHAQRAVDIRQRRLGPDHPETREAIDLLAQITTDLASHSQTNR